MSLLIWSRADPEGKDSNLQRFFFHQFRSGQWMPDLDGRRLADLDEAISVSNEALEELSRSVLVSVSGDQRIVITDAIGDELYVARPQLRGISL